MRYLLALLFLAFTHSLEAASPMDKDRDNFILSQADKFELFPLEYDEKGEAVIRFINAATHFSLKDGYRYFGFRFKTPEQLEGDFAWMYLLRNANGPLSLERLNWYILRKDGTSMEGFSSFFSRKVSSYEELKKLFPHTQGVTIQYLPQKRLRPDTEYVIWFQSLEGDNVPEMAVAFSFLDANQKNLHGKLPLRQTPVPEKIEKSNKDATSVEGDPF